MTDRYDSHAYWLRQRIIADRIYRQAQPVRAMVQAWQQTARAALLRLNRQLAPVFRSLTASLKQGGFAIPVTRKDRE